MATGPFAKVYQSIVDDPMFERVFHNDHALATWLRMLLVADAMYPVSAPMTHRNPTVRLLIDCQLVIERPGNRYSMRGLEAERERRSDAGRIGAAVRWHSESSADPMLGRAEQNRVEQSAGAPATHQGNGGPTSFLASPRGKPKASAHEGQHPDCLVCAPIRPAAAIKPTPAKPAPTARPRSVAP